MSRNDESPAQADGDGARVAPAGHGHGVAGLLELAEQMVLKSALVLDDPDDDGDAAYARAFVLGETLGRRFRHRCAQHHGPHGLAILLEQLACGQDSEQDNPAQALARKGLFSGFCWDLERSFCDVAEAPRLRGDSADAHHAPDGHASPTET